MNTYLENVQNELNQSNLPVELQYDILKATHKMAKNNTDSEITTLVGSPQIFIDNYLRYEHNSHYVKYKTDNLNIDPNDTEKTDDVVPLNEEQFNPDSTSNTSYSTAGSTFKTIYFILITIPLKFIGFTVITLSIISSLILVFSPLSSDDLTTALIVLNLSIILIYNALLELTRVFKEFIVVKVLGGRL